MGSAELESLIKTIRLTRKSGFPDDYGYFAHDDFPLLHEEYELFLMISGDISWFIENRIHDFKPGSLILFNNFEVHKLNVRSNKRFDRLRLLFDPNLARMFSFQGDDLLSCFTGRPLGSGNILTPPAGTLAEILGDFDSLERSIREASLLDTLTGFLALLRAVNKAYGERGEAAEDGGLPELVNLILEYIERHLGGDLSLEAIGEGCGLSIFHMSRLFKRHTGSTVHNFVLYKRVSAAKRYIAEGWPLDEARRLCGFGTSLAFASAFKKIAGVTPAAFARGRPKQAPGSDGPKR